MLGIFESPTFLACQKRWKRRHYFTSYNLRACLIGWVTVLIVIVCSLPFFEIVAFRNALRSVRLRSPSSQHYHEDTTNSGPHDLPERISTDMDLFDLPTAGEDMSKLQPLLMQPPNLDSSEERKAKKSLLEPPIIDSNEVKLGLDTSTDVDRPLPLQMMKLLDPPNYQRVMFVDTPPEERAHLIKTHKPAIATEKGFIRKEDAVRTTYVMGKEDALKWKTGQAAVKWLDIADRTTVGVTVKPVLVDAPTVAFNSFPSAPPKTIKEFNTQAPQMKLHPIIVKTIPPPEQPPPMPIDYGYDEDVSNKISVTRDLPDPRHDTCKKKNYTSLTQQASVIISVYDESWSVILRTIYSVMKRTPKKLLKELIIVDDQSNNQLTLMWEKLKLEIRKWSNIHVFRNYKREGIVRSRMFGALKARGNILVFLDSHVEVNKGWLEPLIERITKNKQTVAVPVLDSISPQDFSYVAGPEIPNSVDAFRWDLHSFKILGPKPSKDDPAGAIPTPVTGHGQFAVSKAFFDSLGGFDILLDTYGGEHMEISLKAWMCGGRVELVPCSRVGHVVRGRLPSLRNANVDKIIQRNLKRVAMVWMDEHRQYFENSIGLLKQLEYGDITDRIALKKKLNCNNFDWYLKNAYPQLYDPKESAIADSEIRSTGMDGTLCLDVFSQAQGIAKMFPCHGDGGNQRFWYTRKGEIRRYDLCLDYWGKKIQFLPCHGLQGNQLWLYITGINKIKHVNANRCLTVVSHDTVDVMDCEDGAMNQQWSLNNFNMTAYEDAGME